MEEVTNGNYQEARSSFSANLCAGCLAIVSMLRILREENLYVTGG